MKQSRMISFIEACIGTAIGFAVSIALSIIVYPLFGHAFTLAQNFWITAIFTVASVARTYAVVSTRTAEVVGYWACGSWDPNQPYQGGPALWTK